jgi:LPPG:FO 2-phospho-L-lactate transferase
MSGFDGKVVAICGGVGGAKLADGLDHLPVLEVVNVPVVAVAPLVGGHAIMTELGVTTNCVSIAKQWPFLAGLVIDLADEAETPHLGVPSHVTNTIMRSEEERVGLALECLKFVDSLIN